ncbi:hypothetical protein KK062_01825 [Fulvivirgaceae bacterium PWU5]|uniref:Zinc finger FPG/IleRS-type domain-containing protein n=1 Tax=Dawidia cretensis TaxID=2782350 RepID=A0AAP2DSZ0_9BACT|nr:hypothetical protein [Dawidia cretensis]
MYEAYFFNGKGYVLIAGIRKLQALGGRSTYFCPACQKL